MQTILWKLSLCTALNLYRVLKSFFHSSIIYLLVVHAYILKDFTRFELIFSHIAQTSCRASQFALIALFNKEKNYWTTITCFVSTNSTVYDSGLRFSWNQFFLQKFVLWSFQVLNQSNENFQVNEQHLSCDSSANNYL